MSEMKLQTNELKMSEDEPDKSVEDQKSINTSGSTQFAVRTWQALLEQSEFVEAEKKPIEVYTKQGLSQLLKHFHTLPLVPKVPPNELLNC